MKGVFYVLAALAVMGLAFWAYHGNYKTQAALNESQRLKSEIGELRIALSTLEAEWAYLNRPERLSQLAEINFDQLKLLPLTPEQFSAIEQVVYPPPPMLDVTEPVEVSGKLTKQEQFP